MLPRDRKSSTVPILVLEEEPDEVAYSIPFLFEEGVVTFRRQPREQPTALAEERHSTPCSTTFLCCLLSDAGCQQQQRTAGAAAGIGERGDSRKSTAYSS